MPSHPLTNFAIQKYYQNEHNLINLDKYKSIEAHWIVLDVNIKNVTYFDSFGFEHTPEKLNSL